MLKLPNITLFAIDRHDKEGIKRAVDICTKDIEFGKVICITDHDMFEGREQYSRFMIERLNEFIDTEFTLTVHCDGYIQSPDAWNNDWLQYDYIGAPWYFHKSNMVGNGGFSLRSKKLLEVLAKLDLTGLDVSIEDDFICRGIRSWLEKEQGIKFAPVEVANKFSIEGYGLMPPFNRWDGEFGFHGYYVSGLPEPPKRKR